MKPLYLYITAIAGLEVTQSQHDAEYLQTEELFKCFAILWYLRCIAICEKLLCSLVSAVSKPRRPPGKRRPPSPCWPWNIRTSLIVLWGVCWMFYTPQPLNGNGLLLDDQWAFGSAQTAGIDLDYGKCLLQVFG